MVYITKTDWSSIQSTLLGKYNQFNKAEKETYTYSTGVFIFIEEICQRLKFSGQGLFHAAMIYFHRYSIQRKRLETIFDKVMLCGACVFIATKVTNRLIFAIDLAGIIYKLLCPSKKSTYTKEKIKEGLIAYEDEVMNGIGFNLDMDLPFKFLLKFKGYLEKKDMNFNTAQLFELCCCKVNDSLILPLCLYFDPDTIAIACIRGLLRQLTCTIEYDEIAILSDYIVSIENVEHCEEFIQLINSNKSNKLTISQFFGVGL